MYKPSKLFALIFWIFLGVIALFVFAFNINEGNYTNIVIFCCIALFLLVLSISLYVYFFSMADRFDVFENVIVFYYDNKYVSKNISEIKEVVIKKYRYTFVFDSPIHVGRYGDYSFLKSEVNDKILRLADNGIKIVRK